MNEFKAKKEVLDRKITLKKAISMNEVILGTSTDEKEKEVAKKRIEIMKRKVKELEDIYENWAFYREKIRYDRKQKK